MSNNPRRARGTIVELTGKNHEQIQCAKLDWILIRGKSYKRHFEANGKT